MTYKKGCLIASFFITIASAIDFHFTVMSAQADMSVP